MAALLSALFAFAVKRRLALANPAKGVERFEEHARERFLKPAELPAFLAAVEAEGEPWRDYFMLCLLTGARRHAVASMAWADVDLDGAVWHIPAARSKNRQPISVALVSKAVELLARRWAEAVNAYVFPSATSGTGHVVEPARSPWLRVVKRAGLSDLRLHDVRRTVGSWLASAGASGFLIQKALGHASLQSTAVYARLDLGPVREALEATTERLTGGN